MRGGKRIPSASFVFIYKKSEIPTTRFAVIVSKKIDKRAVRRNRMKRLLYQAIVGLLQTFTGVDGVILVKKGMPDSVGEIQQVLARVWKKI